MEHKFLDFQKELTNLQEKDELVDTLKEEENIHGSPANLAAWITDV